MNNKNIIAANNGKLPVKGSTDIQVQLQKFTSEIAVEFLVTKIEINVPNKHASFIGHGFLILF